MSPNVFGGRVHAPWALALAARLLLAGTIVGVILLAVGLICALWCVGRFVYGSSLTLGDSVAWIQGDDHGVAPDTRLVANHANPDFRPA